MYKRQRHPYTKALLSAIPIPDPEKKMERIQLNGELTSPINVGAGCRFAKRCLYAKPECSTQNPQLTEVEPGHFVSCIKCKMCIRDRFTYVKRIVPRKVRHGLYKLHT